MSLASGPYKGPTVLAVMWVLVSLSSVVILLRVYCKRCISRACGWDDAIACAALVSTSNSLFQAGRIDHYAAQVLHIVSGAIYTRTVTMGVAGRHLDDLKDQSRTNEAMVLFGVGQTIGIVCLSLSRTSFAISLIRVSPCRVMKGFLWFLIVTMNFLMLGSASIYMIQCQPPAALWDTSLRQTGTCWSQNLVTILTTTSHAYSGLVDLALALIPWPWIWKLRMKKREKFGIGISMSLGICAMGIAFLKAGNQHTIPTYRDYTYLAQALILCSIIEECVTILAGSMPSLRVLFVRMRGSHNRPSSFSFVKHSALTADGSRKFTLRLPGSKKRTENTWGRPGEDIQMVAMHENDSEQGIMGRQTSESSIRNDRYPGGGGEASADPFGSPSGYSAKVQKV
ncbi:hypothetical protein P168DRAFT_284659 [Aspergillus campestris IBT 28561]|uniref:Rhodopsin domain-containing protein n=1 Tax=Aspergillus campestris (strain IBT 28561) TaxID=1392248 RepID=A0A2I1CU07_ASPC2|nr:uncharacterized protein P168DRAFT_284659 [Aspergillus campestris IBT 28561]PKY01116.1 hypothetical protein P168DRAFT_284659 [Aspergillus campestris IBT 28561]